MLKNKLRIHILAQRRNYNIIICITVNQNIKPNIKFSFYHSNQSDVTEELHYCHLRKQKKNFSLIKT